MKSESLMKLAELLKAVSGKLVGSEKDENLFCFTSVQTDSRNVVEKTLFVPLVGEKQDGHIYCEKAIESGASVVLINNSEYEKKSGLYERFSSENEGVFIICVENTLKGLQDAARGYVEKFPNLIKIAVTGSSGKTTTKELIVSVLSQKYNVVYTKGNFNSETGLPLSVFNIRDEHEVGVFEMGMNRKDEINEISSVLKANYAIVTNIGSAHIGILGSRENIAEEKRHVYDYINENGAAFIPFSDDFKDFLAQNVKGEIIYYGNFVSALDSGVHFVRNSGVLGTVFTVDGIEVNLRLPGLYNYTNALGAIAIGKKLGLDACEIKNGLENVNAISGRMETSSIIVRNGNKITLIKDCYNANPDSMKSVLNFCKALKNVNHKLYVLGDMLELGENSENEHSSIGGIVACDNPDLCVFVGNEMKYAYDNAVRFGFLNGKYVKEYDDDAIKIIASYILEKIQENDVLLIKASRGIALERIIPVIEQNGAMNGKI